MSSKLPSMQFYPGDWMKDPALRAVSSASRGLWIDMLCLMWESARRGFLVHTTGRPVSTEQLARMTGNSVDETAKMLEELEDCGVVSRNKDGILYSRRIERDERKRLKCVEAGKRGGNPALKGEDKGTVKGEGKGEPNPNPTPSSSTSFSPSDNTSEEAIASSAGGEPCDEPPENDRVFLCIPTNKYGTSGEEYRVTENMIDDFETLFPAVDVRQQIRNMRAWSVANKQKRKTISGMPAFITTWLTKEQNRGSRTVPHQSTGIKTNGRTAAPNPAEYAELAAELGIGGN